MTFPSDCDDQLTGPDCNVTWFDELSPYSDVVSYTLGVYMVILAVLSVSFIFKNKLHSCAEFRRQKKRMHRQSYVDTDVGFKRGLLLFVFAGAATMELGHAVYFYFGMLLEFPLDTPEGFWSTFALIFSLSIAFCTAFCVTTVFQVTIVAPIQGNFANMASLARDSSKAGLIDLKIIQAEDFKGVMKFLGPVCIGWIVVFVLMFMDVLQTPIEVYRAYCFYTSTPLFLQGLILNRTKDNLVLIIDSILQHRGLSDANIDKYMGVKLKMQTYAFWMSVIFYQNSFMVFLLSVTPVAHNLYVFFVLNTILAISLAGVGTNILLVFHDGARTKTKTKSRNTGTKPTSLTGRFKSTDTDQVQSAPSIK